MNKKTKFFLVSLIMPGFGYLLFGESRKLYVTIILFYSIVALGAILRLYPTFSGFIFILLSLSILHVGTAAHAAISRNKNRSHAKNRALKWTITTTFFLLAITGFSNSRTMLGFDRVSMSVPVMEPGIMQGEQLLVDTRIYNYENPKRGDIVIHSFSGQKGLFLNRIIALGGDSIQISRGKVVINGVEIMEPYVNSENATKAESRKMELMVLQANSFFVMGDNRDKSFGDSRFNGAIDRKDIQGKVRYIFYSKNFSRIGKNLNNPD